MKLSLRVILTTTLLTMSVLTVAALGYNAYRNARFTAEDLSSQILDQNTRRIDSRIDLLLDLASRQGRLDSGLIRDREFNDDAFAWLSRYWMEVLKVHPRMSRESLGLEATGEWAFVRRLPDGKMAIGELRRDPSTGLMDLKDYWPDQYPNHPFAVRSDVKDQDPRAQPWYMAAKRAGHQIWSETYVFDGIEKLGHVPGVSCTTPIFDDDGSLRGVLTSSFDVIALCNFLKDLKVGSHGFAFVVELRGNGERRVIAHPKPEILVRRAAPFSDDDLMELVPPNQLADALVPAFLRRLDQRLTPTPATETTRIGFEHDGVSYLGAFRRLSTNNGPKWLICTMMPEQDVMARVDSSNRETRQIATGILIVAMLVGLFVSARVARPLERVIRETARIGRFEVEARPAARSMIVEVDNLALVVEKTKTSLRSFGKYVPTDLIREILASGREATLGGDRRPMTVFFADLANFTTLAEKLPPEDLVRQMGDYFGRFSADIEAGGGTVDKYIGDAIMAFWGAPNPCPNHAVAACLTALRNQASMEELHRQWRAEGKPELTARIGIMTGEAVVGNVGSPARLNYTAMGDTVNLASRLEGLGKYYGTRMLIGEPTYQEALETVLARAVDWVSVKGKTEGMLIYELLALRSEARPELVELANLSERALALYRSREWEEALAIFEEMGRLRPGDGPSRVLAERCLAFLDSPPAEDWDGVHRMAIK